MRPFLLDRIFPFPLFALALALIAFGSPAARAQDATDNNDSGFGGGHKYRVGFGLAPVVSDSSSTTDLAESGGLSEFLKADVTLKRPKQEEYLASVWYVHGNFNLHDQETTTTLGALTYEYRYRYFGHGIGYTGYGLGLATGDLLTTSAKVANTTTVGIDIGHVFVEFRTLFFGWDHRAIESFFVGGRF